MSARTAVSLSYFGKLPARGDFLRGGHNAALLQTLDRWLSQGLEAMSLDARWKLVYDQAAPAHFAFLGVKSHFAIAGHLLASSDSSGRRFPFVTAGTFEVAQPVDFLRRAPLALSRLWTRCANVARQAQAADDPGSLLHEIAQVEVDLDIEPQAYEANYTDFIEMQTVGTLDEMLAASGHALSLRQTVLAIGLLLQPVLGAGLSQIEKGAVLPLPGDALYRPLVAAFWLDLLVPFLERGDFELALYQHQPAGSSRHQLVIGFNGAAPSALQSVLDAPSSGQFNVALAESEWVEEFVADDYAIKKLSTYLQQPQLSLRQAALTFREAFLGT